MRTCPLAREPQFPRQSSHAPASKRAEAKLDRTTARAMVDAGYMSLRDYIEQFGFDGPSGEGDVVKVSDHGSPGIH